MMGIMVPETCWASNKICNKNHLLHPVGILFPHIQKVPCSCSSLNTTRQFSQPYISISRFMVNIYIFAQKTKYCGPRNNRLSLNSICSYFLVIYNFYFFHPLPNIWYFVMISKNFLSISNSFMLKLKSLYGAFQHYDLSCLLYSYPNKFPHSSPEAPRIIQMRETSTSEGGNYYQFC
jgi:hypothetical protein